MTTPSDNKPKHKLRYDDGVTSHDVANCPECEKGMVKDMKKLTDAIVDHDKPKERCEYNCIRKVDGSHHEACPANPSPTDGQPKWREWWIEFVGHWSGKDMVYENNPHLDKAVHVIESAAVVAAEAQLTDCNKIINNLHQQVQRAEAEIARLKELSNDRLDDWKRIQDSERKLYEAEREIASEKSIAEHWKGNMNLARNERDYFQAENERLTKENAGLNETCMRMANERLDVEWPLVQENLRLTKQTEEQAKEIVFGKEMYATASNKLLEQNEIIADFFAKLAEFRGNK